MDRHELTRRHYADVLIDLCETRSLFDITATDLIEAAQTARQTFYNHFSDINDLICYTAFLPMKAVTDPFTNETSTHQAYDETLKRKSFFVQLSRQTGQNNFWDALTPWLERTYCERYLVGGLTESEAAYRRAAINLYCAGSAAMFRDWCAQGMEMPVDAIVEVLYDMSPSFVKDDLMRMPARMGDYPR